MLLNIGLSLWHASEACYRDGRSLQLAEWLQNPFLIGSTRELASGRSEGFGSWWSMLCSYSPPIIYFRPAEQRLLLAALMGLTDEQLTDELGNFALRREEDLAQCIRSSGQTHASGITSHRS